MSGDSKDPSKGGKEGSSTAGVKEDADDLNGKLVPLLTLIIGVRLKLPNLSE